MSTADRKDASDSERASDSDPKHSPQTDDLKIETLLQMFENLHTDDKSEALCCLAVSRNHRLIRHVPVRLCTEKVLQTAFLGATGGTYKEFVYEWSRHRSSQ
jgi:hypothetical protein